MPQNDKDVEINRIELRFLFRVNAEHTPGATSTHQLYKSQRNYDNFDHRPTRPNT